MADNETDNDDDFALFRQEVKDAQPLRQNRAQIETPQKTSVRLMRTASQTPRLQDPFSTLIEAELVGNEETLSYQGEGVQHRLFSKLRTGRIHLEAELDLHGLTLDAARMTLADFIQQCQIQQIRCVRLIHGKGWTSREQKPVLKSHLNQWLRQHPAILAFHSATVEDGGTGALYVLLRRKLDPGPSTR